MITHFSKLVPSEDSKLEGATGWVKVNKKGKKRRKKKDGDGGIRWGASPQIQDDRNRCSHSPDHSECISPGCRAVEGTH